MEGYAAVKGQSVPLNGSSCAQVKAWRIVALDGERASASGGASQNLRLRTK
jgi:FAD/FMN-containing dehydrogenase